MNRREFLRRGLVATATGVGLGSGLALGAGQEQEREGGHPHGEERPPVVGQKKGIPFREVKLEGSIQKKFQLLKDIGFDGVEIDSPLGLPRDAYLERRKELLDARDQTELEIYAVTDAYAQKEPFTSPDPMVRRRGFSALATAIADGAIYGARSVRLCPGFVTAEVGYDDAYVRAQEEIQRVLPLVDQAHLDLTIENARNRFLLSPLELAAFVADLGHEHVGVHLNVGNVVPNGWPQHWIRILGDKVVTVGLSDFSHKKGNEEGLPRGFDVKLREGDVAWTEVMAAVGEVRPNGWFTADVPGGDEERLLDIVDRMDQIIGS